MREWKLQSLLPKCRSMLVIKKGMDMENDLREHFEVSISEEHEDGSATLTIEYNKDFRAALRDIYARQRCTKKLVKTFVLEGIDTALNRHTKGETSGN